MPKLRWTQRDASDNHQMEGGGVRDFQEKVRRRSLHLHCHSTGLCFRQYLLNEKKLEPQVEKELMMKHGERIVLLKDSIKGLMRIN